MPLITYMGQRLALNYLSYPYTAPCLPDYGASPNIFLECVSDR